MNKTFDVVVIGGGIIGSSAAYHLAEDNLNVALINTSKLGSASKAAAGLLTPFQHNDSSHLINFLSDSLNYFTDFYSKIKDHVNVNLGFKQSGSLYLVQSNYELREKEAEIRKLKNIDHKITFLNKRETANLESSVTREIIGSYYYPKEGIINNPKFLKAIQTCSQDKKVTIVNKEVMEIFYSKNLIEYVLLSSGDKIFAKNFVLCNGVWANRLLNEVLDLQKDIVSAVKGEVL